MFVTNTVSKRTGLFTQHQIVIKCNSACVGLGGWLTIQSSAILLPSGAINMFTVQHYTHDDFWDFVKLHSHNQNDEDFPQHVHYLKPHHSMLSFNKELNIKIHILAICIEEPIYGFCYSKTKTPKWVQKASIKKTPIGVVEVWYEYGYYALSYISVRVDHRNQGLSKKLIDGLIDFCKENNITKIKRTRASDSGEKYTMNNITTALKENNIEFFY